MQKGYAHLALLFLLGFIAAILIFKFMPVIRNRVIGNIQPLARPLVTTQPKVASISANPRLEKYLAVEAALLGVSDNISLSFKDFNSQQEIAINPSRSWIPASTIKSFVVLEAFRQKRLGRITFDQPITIQAQNVVPTELETDDYPKLREGVQATIRQLVEAMVVQSDNTAYNTLLDVLDRRKINATLQSLGLTETVVGEKLNLDNDQLAIDYQVPGRLPNTTTSKDLTTLFELLYGQKLQDSEDMLAVFKMQKINNMIPALLPQNVTIAHKTGDWAPIYNDGGVVYKPDDPFVLSVFTNSNNPNVIAKLAQVAYYQSAQMVGADLKIPNQRPISSTTQPVFLAQAESQTQVLGETTTSSPLPEVTAADLGITSGDITSDSQATKKVPSALVAPGSILYTLKRWWEEFTAPKASQSPSQQVEGLLKQSSSRLAELKTTAQNGDLSSTAQLLKEAEQDLHKAVTVATADQAADLNLLKVKQYTDLHYAVLAEVAKGVKDSQKEQFIDMVYDFQQKNNNEVKLAVKTSIIANPLEQKPLIGTVKSQIGNEVTLQFENGSEKKIVVNDYTPVRAVGESNLASPAPATFAAGQKIAVVGQITKDNKIFPQFILKNVPKDLPDKQEGVILSIDPQEHTLEIQKPSGEKSEIQVTPETRVKGSDTNVSIEGITVGSGIVVSGTTSSANSSATPGLLPTSNSTVKDKSPSTVPGKQISGGAFSATTITVVKNDSGKNEKSEPPKPSNNKPSGKEQPKPENKHEDPKKH